MIAAMIDATGKAHEREVAAAFQYDRRATLIGVTLTPYLEIGADIKLPLTAIILGYRSRDPIVATGGLAHLLRLDAVAKIRFVDLARS